MKEQIIFQSFIYQFVWLIVYVIWWHYVQHHPFMYCEMHTQDIPIMLQSLLLWPNAHHLPVSLSLHTSLHLQNLTSLDVIVVVGVGFHSTGARSALPSHHVNPITCLSSQVSPHCWASILRKYSTYWNTSNFHYEETVTILFYLSCSCENDKDAPIT